MLALPPLPASDALRCRLIDVRPTTERYSGMGFVAGSRSLPQLKSRTVSTTLIARTAGPKLPVLMCLTGMHAKTLAHTLSGTATFPLGYLEGGLMAWNASGLPIAGWRLGKSRATPLRISDAHRQVRIQLDALLADFPLRNHDTAESVLGRCIARPDRSPRGWSPPHLRALLERLTVELLDLGIPRWRVTLLFDALATWLPLA